MATETSTLTAQIRAQNSKAPFELSFELSPTEELVDLVDSENRRLFSNVGSLFDSKADSIRLARLIHALGKLHQLRLWIAGSATFHAHDVRHLTEALSSYLRQKAIEPYQTKTLLILPASFYKESSTKIKRAVRQGNFSELISEWNNLKQSPSAMKIISSDSVDYRVAAWHSADVKDQQETNRSDDRITRTRRKDDRLDPHKDSWDQSLRISETVRNIVATARSQQLDAIQQEVDRLQVLRAADSLLELSSMVESYGIGIVDEEGTPIEQLNSFRLSKDQPNTEVPFPRLRAVGMGNRQYQRVRNRIGTSLIEVEPEVKVSTMTPDEFFRYFDLVREHVSRKVLIRQMQLWLNSIPEDDRHFEGSIDRKRTFARDLNERAKAIGLRFKCPRCDSASGLSAIQQGNSRTGQFFFSHQSEGKRVMHSLSAILPNLSLIEASST